MMLLREGDKSRQDKRGMDLSLKKVTALPNISQLYRPISLNHAVLLLKIPLPPPSTK